jgi:hypothetical protein
MSEKDKAGAILLVLGEGEGWLSTIGIYTTTPKILDGQFLEEGEDKHCCFDVFVENVSNKKCIPLPFITLICLRKRA